jgi:hypothetical protein
MSGKLSRLVVEVLLLPALPPPEGETVTAPEITHNHNED